MRLAVLDMGSNTAHLLLVDAYPGARPLPAYEHKIELLLSELLDDKGRVTSDGVDRLVAFCAEALEIAEDKGAESMLAFATSALREATNGDKVIERIREKTGLDLRVLGGEDEARLTFLAVRRWYGWSSGRLLCVDIGGGSLEIAVGIDEDPDTAVSLPLGAGRLTRAWFTADPPAKSEIRELRRHVRAQVASVVGAVSRFGRPDKAVATSKTFRSIARVAGAASSDEGPYIRRTLERAAVADMVSRFARMDTAERSRLPGVSAKRAAQLLAGVIVADATMDLFEIDSLDICPWALREGVILRRLDNLPDAAA